MISLVLDDKLIDINSKDYVSLILATDGTVTPSEPITEPVVSTRGVVRFPETPTINEEGVVEFENVPVLDADGVLSF